MEGNKKYLSVREVANLIGMAEITIRTWCASRYLTYVKLGRSVRIPIAEVDRLVSEGLVPARRAR